MSILERKIPHLVRRDSNSSRSRVPFESASDCWKLCSKFLALFWPLCFNCILIVKRISCKEFAEVDLDIFKLLGVYYLTYTK